MTTAPSIPENLDTVRKRIAEYAVRYSREPASIRLIAVSKTKPAALIRQAHDAGQRDFGENYLQEALGKMEETAELSLTWHFIGPIQSNKTRELAERFDWIHTVDREKIARRLHEARPPGRGPLNVLLQVNISGETSKSGVSLAAIPGLAAAVAALPGLRLRGLMAIPAPETDMARQRTAFRLLAAAAAKLREGGHPACTELSMGMSADFEAAIAEGATMIRIGTDIFGARK